MVADIGRANYEVVGIANSAALFTPLTTLAVKGFQKINDTIDASHGCKRVGLEVAVRLLQPATLVTRPIDAVIQVLVVPIFAVIQEVQLCHLYFARNRPCLGLCRIMVVPIMLAIKICQSLGVQLFLSSLAVATEPFGVLLGLYSPATKVDWFFSKRRGLLDLHNDRNNRIPGGDRTPLMEELVFEECVFPQLHVKLAVPFEAYWKNTGHLNMFEPGNHPRAGNRDENNGVSPLDLPAVQTEETGPYILNHENLKLIPKIVDDSKFVLDPDVNSPNNLERMNKLLSIWDETLANVYAENGEPSENEMTRDNGTRKAIERLIRNSRLPELFGLTVTNDIPEQIKETIQEQSAMTLQSRLIKIAEALEEQARSGNGLSNSEKLKIFRELQFAGGKCTPTWLEVSNTLLKQIRRVNGADNMLLTWLQELKEETCKLYVDAHPETVDWHAMNTIRYHIGKEVGLDFDATGTDGYFQKNYKPAYVEACRSYLLRELTPTRIVEYVKKRMEKIDLEQKNEIGTFLSEHLPPDAVLEEEETSFDYVLRNYYKNTDPTNAYSIELAIDDKLITDLYLALGVIKPK